MIILARKILPISAPPIDNGAILITGKKIVELGRQKHILKKYPREKVVDLSGLLIMPGLVNAHTHLELSYLKGRLGEKRDFFDWITALVDLRRKSGLKGVKEPMVSAFKEAISSGTTCVGDIAYTDSALPILIKSGIRSVSFIEVIGLDNGKAGETFDGLLKRLDRLKSATPDRIIPGISPHSPYSVSGLLLKKIKEYISSNDINISIHLSETYDEMLYMQGKPSGMDGYMKKFGWDKLRPGHSGTSLEYLKSFGLHRRLLAVHSTHVTNRDTKVLGESGASVVHCPRSNHFLMVGKAPVEDFLKAGINVCIGTDSLASNIDLDLWEEMRFAYLVNRISAHEVLKMATINGAGALGLEDVTGSLEPGKDADLIAVESDAALLDDPYQRLLLETKRGDISFTMVQGKAIYSRDGYICNGL